MNWIRYYKTLKERSSSAAAPLQPARPFPICPKMSLPCVPFATWAMIARSIYDLRQLKPRALDLLYCEYTTDVRSMGFDVQGEWILEEITMKSP